MGGRTIIHSTKSATVVTDPLVSLTGPLGPGPTGSDLIVNVDLPDPDARPADCLRLLLVADVLRRIVEEIVGARAETVILPQGAQLPDPLEHLRAALHLLPNEARRASPVHGYEPSRRRESITLTSADRSPLVTPAVGTTVLPVEEVLPRGVQHDLVAWLLGRDPLTARLTLLRFNPSVPAILSAARLHRASETLERWRFKVAGWRDAPPAPAAQLNPLLELLANACDTAGVLLLMHRIETDHVIPSGAKYTVFVNLDRVLGLDLTRRQFGPNVW